MSMLDDHMCSLTNHQVVYSGSGSVSVGTGVVVDVVVDVVVVVVVVVALIQVSLYCFVFQQNINLICFLLSFHHYYHN